MSHPHRVAFISHCHFAPCVMARPPTTGAVLAPALITWAERNKIELMQMRCPETEFAGPDRSPHGRAFYNKAVGFRALCSDIADYEANRMIGLPVIGVIGVTTSPACGTNFTGSSPYQPSGIYMEELSAACKLRDMSMKFINVWPKHRHKMIENLNGLLNQ